MTITAQQIRAARSLLDWKQSDLAERSGISLPSINNVERNFGSPRLSTLETLRTAFQGAGVEFIGNNGVKLHDEIFEMKEFKGDDFMKHLNDDLFFCMRNARDEVLIYGLDESMASKYAPDEVLRYDDHQKETGFQQKILVREDHDYFYSSPECYRWISPQMLGIAPYTVYHDRVAMIMWKKKRVILIRSQDIADTFRSQFEFLWEQAKPVPQNSRNKLDDPAYREKLKKSKKQKSGD